MIALDVIIRSIILSSGTGKFFDGRALGFYWNPLTHKLWIDTFDEVVQKKIAKDLTDAGLVQPNQIEMSEDYHSVVIIIPRIEDIEEVRKLITDQLNNEHGINDANFSAKLLFKGILIDSYWVDYRDTDTPLKLSVSFLFNLEDTIEMCFSTWEDKLKYGLDKEGYLMLDGKKSNILLVLTFRSVIHKHYEQYGTIPTEFVHWAIAPNRQLAVAATKHHLFVWNDECVDASCAIVIPVVYHKYNLDNYPDCIQIKDSEQFTVRANGIHYTYNKRGELIATSA